MEKYLKSRRLKWFGNVERVRKSYNNGDEERANDVKEEFVEA